MRTLVKSFLGIRENPMDAFRPDCWNSAVGSIELNGSDDIIFARFTQNRANQVRQVTEYSNREMKQS